MQDKWPPSENREQEQAVNTWLQLDNVDTTQYSLTIQTTAEGNAKQITSTMELRGGKWVVTQLELATVTE